MGYGPGPELGCYSYGLRGSPMLVCLLYHLLTNAPHIGLLWE
jgi:hypothetical protein